MRAPTVHSPAPAANGLNVTTSPEYKLIVVGPRQVGKSALVVRFLTRRFINEYLENTEMTCNRKVRVDGEYLKLNIQDSSEKSMRSTSLDHYYRWADAIMMVFALNDLNSFLQLKTLLKRLMERKSEKFSTPVVLVGNKCDLERSRSVSKNQALEFAKKLGCNYYESSAREGLMTLVTDNSSTERLTTTEVDLDVRHSPTELESFSKDRKRSNSADVGRVLGGKFSSVMKNSLIKRWSSQNSLSTISTETSVKPAFAASSDNESDTEETTTRHKRKSSSAVKAKKLLKAAGKLSPMFVRKLSPSQEKKKRNKKNENVIVIPGLVMNSLQVTKSDCAIGTGDANFMAIHAEKFAPSQRNYSSSTDSSSSYSSSSVFRSRESFCAQPFVQLCREAKRRRQIASAAKFSALSETFAKPQAFLSPHGSLHPISMFS